MIVHQIQVGIMANFTYVLQDEATRHAIVVDPSWDLDKVEDAIRKHDLIPKYILNTHHHFDHTLGNEALARSTGTQIIQHPDSGIRHDIAVNEGDEVSFGETMLKVLHTPGHSPDSICLLDDSRIITGDTLFVGSCGRVDLPGGSAPMLYRSLARLMTLDGSLEVYPGHNYGSTSTSTISREKMFNPVLQYENERDFLAMMGYMG